MESLNSSGSATQWTNRLLRRSELALVAYFFYAAGLALALRLPPATSGLIVGISLTIVVGYPLLAYVAWRRPGKALPIVRDWLPIAVVLLAYRQMGLFAPAQHTFELERSWVVWDRLLLNDWGLRGAIEFFGPLGPSVLEVSYSLVYVIAPGSVAILYIAGRRRSSDRFLFTFVVGALLSYALFPFFPSEPPRAVFPGEDFPSVDTVFRRFNLWLLGGYGIHTSVFPSAHVSAAFAAAFGMLRVLAERRWVGWALVGLAVCIFLATIYGRYHYAVDGVAGVAVSLVALAVTEAAERMTGRTAT